MTEDFICYLWKFRLINQPAILSSGENVTVIDPGIQNFNSGPDFQNARIRIDDTVWAGNVEIHINASDWNRHDHQFDPAYDNVILHVVYLEDKSIRRKNGESIPALEIYGKFDDALYARYKNLIGNHDKIPCAQMIGNADRFTINNWLDRILIERLDHKTTEVIEKLQFNEGNWPETFYQQLARNFGFRVNALPFELLSRSLPMKILSKHKDDLLLVEALLFGQAGLLSKNLKDAYYSRLKSDYDFLTKKYNLVSMDGHLWRFMRMRPGNFPTIRISQFAGLICKSSHLLSKVLESEKINDFTGLFATEASEYWDDHFVFGKKSPKKKKVLGRNAILLILINTVVPFMFTYGKNKNDPETTDKALKILEGLPGESNAEIARWRNLGMNTRTAFRSQALLQLGRNYCANKRCLQCAIGNRIITGGDEV